MRIYVASSWRNKYQPAVVAALRILGYQVYDFRGAGDGWGNGGDGPGGFGWSEIDPNWKDGWTQEVTRYISALNHPRAIEGFDRDMLALKSADACLMVNPCGQSAHAEMGWAVGSGLPTVVYCPEIREPDLMVKMANLITANWDSVTTYLDGLRKAVA